MKKVTYKYRLKGHESFAIREGWITKGLVAVESNPFLFSENYGADELGVGSNMAKSIRYWLTTANLIEDHSTKGVTLSEVGRVIYEKDMCVGELFTLGLIHYLLVRNHDKLTTWNVFFNQVDLEDFTKEDLTEVIGNLICEEGKLEEISERSLSDDVSCLFQMYTRDVPVDYDPEEKKISPFIRLSLLKREGNKYRKNQPDREAIDRLLILVVLLDFFEREEVDSVSIDELMKAYNGPAHIFHLKRYRLVEYLDQLAAEQNITVNHTAGLDMVYKNCDLSSLDVIKSYYTTRSK